MGKENSKFWAEGSIEELGELISLVRSDYLELTPLELSRQIDTKVDTVEKCEAGKSMHGTTVLKKTCERFNLKFNILISTK